MTNPGYEAGPPRERGAGNTFEAGCGATSTIPRGIPATPVLTRAEVYAVVRGRLVAHVIVKDHTGRITVRPYRNIGAADRAARRATEVRGHAATVVLVRQDVAPLVGVSA